MPSCARRRRCGPVWWRLLQGGTWEGACIGVERYVAFEKLFETVPYMHIPCNNVEGQGDFLDIEGATRNHLCHHTLHTVHSRVMETLSPDFRWCSVLRMFRDTKRTDFFWCLIGRHMGTRPPLEKIFSQHE